MSRIGNALVLIPAGVAVLQTGHHLVVKGPKGELQLKLPRRIKAEVSENQITIKRSGEEKRIKALHGLVRAKLNNMILGVSQGWSKNLELVGVGFRAQGSGNKLVLNVGYSHPVELTAPEGVTFEVADNTKIKVSGIDKELVGAVAASVKKVRVPDVYKGKGVRYEGEYIRKKAGKAAKIAGAPGGTK